MDIQLLTSEQDMNSFVKEWKELFENANHKSIYNHPDFCLNWMEHFGCVAQPGPKGSKSDPSDECFPAKPMVLLGRNQGCLDVVLPFRIFRSLPRKRGRYTLMRLLDGRRFWCLEGLINTHNDRASLLVRSGSEAFGSKVIAHAFRSFLCQRMNLGYFPSESPLSTVMRSPSVSIRHRLGRYETCYLPFLSTFSAYVSARPALAKKVSKVKRVLERDFGPVSLDWWKGRDALDKGFPAFVDVDALSWKASREGGESLAHCPLPFAYYRELTKRFARQGCAHVWQLRLAGEPAAATLCYEVDGVLYQYKTSYKETFGGKGGRRPGYLLAALFIECAWPHFRAIDFMSESFHGDWEYKTYPVESETRFSMNPLAWLHSGERGYDWKAMNTASNLRHRLPERPRAPAKMEDARIRT